MNLEKLHESISLPCNAFVKVDIVVESEFVRLTHSEAK